MLVLRRTEGQWIEVTHRSGERLRFRTYGLHEGRVQLAFDDPERNFAIQRSERPHSPPAAETETNVDNTST